TSVPTGPTGTTTRSWATFRLSADEPATFKCTLNSGTAQDCGGVYNLDGLATGSYTLTVAATDRAGNVDATPETVTWTVDATAPDTSISSNPGATTTDTAPDFVLASTGGGVSYECRAVLIATGADALPWASCPSSWSPSAPLDDGAYRFEFRAKDAAGNVDDTPATFNVTIAQAAAVATASGSPKVITVTGGRERRRRPHGDGQLDERVGRLDEDAGGPRRAARRTRR
ncbi:MAG: Ig-like domain repeat protein, partial [Patulibacter minatonensis]